MFVVFRAVLALVHAGANDVRLLNGGWLQWVASGLPTQAGPISQHERDFEMIWSSPRPELIASIDFVSSIVASPTTTNATLVSIRSWAEFTGDLSGYESV